MRVLSRFLVTTALPFTLAACFPAAGSRPFGYSELTEDDARRKGRDPAVTIDPYAPLRLIEKDTVKVSDSAPKDPLLVILKKYSPEAYMLVRRAERMSGEIRIGSGYMIHAEGAGRRTVTINGVTTTTELTNKGFRKWISDDTNFDKQLGDVTTAVHEMFHGHTGRNTQYLFSKRLSSSAPITVQVAPGSWRYLVYDTLYLDRENILYSLRRSTDFAPHNPAVPASVLTNTVPESRRSFRWKTYVSGSVYQSTLTSGISGLLDEYAAYYWSTKVAWDLYGYYRTERGGAPRTMADWVSKVSLYYFAWAEFRMWILEYLAYCERREPGIWKSLLGDERLRRAFTAVDDRYTALVTAFFTRLFKEFPDQYRQAGIKVRVAPATASLRGGVRRLDMYYDLGGHSRSLMSYDFIPQRDEMAGARLTRIANLFRTSPQGALPELRRPETRTEL